MSIPEIATVTRIPVRSLERLESGLFEELPADVFVRGFLRSYARCVGLDAEEIIRRYTHCGMTPAPVCAPVAGELDKELGRQDGGQLASELRAVPAALEDEVRRVPRALLRSGGRHGTEDEQRASETRPKQVAASGLEPGLRSSGPESVAGVEQRTESGTEPRAETLQVAIRAGDDDDQQPKRKRKRRRRKPRRDLVEASVAQPADPEPAPRQRPVESAVQTAQVADFAPGSRPTGSVGAGERAAAPSAVPVVSDGVPQPSTGRVNARSQSVRQQTTSGLGGSGRVRASTVTARPVLIIDDEHPEDAERSQEERVERTDASWRSFLPPALLDSDDGSHRGTLTLAVIILVIVATLTMSYLLRRPNVSGDGVTWQRSNPGQIAKTSSPRARA